MSTVPAGFEPPFVVCQNCGTYTGDMGRNVACDECGDPLPTGRQHWVTGAGEPYPKKWAEHFEKM